MPELQHSVDNRSQLRDYLALSFTHGIGPLLIKRLLASFGNATAVRKASPQELSEIEGIGVKTVRAIRDDSTLDYADKILSQCEAEAIQIVLPGDPQFPRLLKEIPDSPAQLFVRGELSSVDDLSIAIVGTRSATAYGRNQAERFARSLTLSGLTIVSGLARGVDSAAHLGALDAGGRTIAVLSSGVAEIYPPQNQQLAERIIKSGALISEMPPGAVPSKGMFPHRNRIISGLSLGTLVIEAGERSGALITARLAGEHGRDVFALPGLVSNLNARGCHQLIRDGAMLVQSPEEVIDSLGPLSREVNVTPDVTVRHPTELNLNDQEMAVLQAIDVEPTDINNVVIQSGLPVSRVLSTLSVLEMRRLVRRISGQIVQRV